MAKYWKNNVAIWSHCSGVTIGRSSNVQLWVRFLYFLRLRRFSLFLPKLAFTFFRNFEFFLRFGAVKFWAEIWEEKCEFKSTSGKSKKSRLRRRSYISRMSKEKKMSLRWDPFWERGAATTHIASIQSASETSSSSSKKWHKDFAKKFIQKNRKNA